MSQTPAQASPGDPAPEGVRSGRPGAALRLALAAFATAASLSAPAQGPAEAPTAAAATVEGLVTVRIGALPRDLRVRATPLLGGPARTAPVDRRGRFTLEPLPTGAYRFEVLLANNIVFAEAGAVETSLSAGPNRLTLLVQRGRVEPSRGAFGEWPLSLKVWAVAGGVVAAALACEAADCRGEDDEGEGNASPSAP